MTRPIRFEFHIETRASDKAAFEVLSDTDAFNDVVKAGMMFRAETSVGGKPQTLGSVSRLGVTIRWIEPPFSFRSPSWFRIERKFQNGPAGRMTAHAVLSPLPAGGCAIDYTVEVEPRNALFRPILGIDLNLTVLPNLKSALERVRELLDAKALATNDDRTIAAPAPRLDSKAAARLEERTALIARSPLRDRLVAFLRAAPLRAQSQMSPIAFAKSWSAPLESVTPLFVAATEAGLLGVRVDLLCPACLIPKGLLDDRGRPSQVHCETCNIALDASYPESLAVHFFPSPDIRDFRVRTECLGSPAKTPHVVSQDVVGPGESMDVGTALEFGTYQVRTLPARGPAALIEVREVVESEARIRLSSSLHPQWMQLRPGVSPITFTNDTDESVTVRVERLEPRSRVLTLGRLLVEYPGLRARIPGAGFATLQTAFVGVAVALRLEDDASAASVAAALSGAKIGYASGPIALGIYADWAGLLRDLDGKLDLPLLMGAARGVVSICTLGNRSVPVGSGVDRSLEAMRQSFRGELCVADPQDEELALAMRAAGLNARTRGAAPPGFAHFETAR